MTDYSELKCLAEAATPGPWVKSAPGEVATANYETDGEIMCDHIASGFGYGGSDPDDAAFVAAANPAAVLGLISELEKFDDGMRALACSLGAGGYNAATLTADQLVGKVSAGLEMFTTSTGGLLDKVTAEREALKAECEGLREDAGRYRWICDNACDLNFYASSHGADGKRTEIAGRVEIDPGQYPVDEFGTAKESLDVAIDAAMEQGGQSNG